MLATDQRETTSSSLPNVSTAQLGVLAADAFGTRFRYRFTAEDVLWLARFLVGEAGGRDDAGNRAVVWAMFNRFALFTHRVYPTFSRFLRAYSTPLQPVLNSRGAAQRHMNSPNFVRTGGTYPNSDVPKGQLRQFLALQQRSWSNLPEAARRLALRAVAGAVPNPIGNASEFASTFVYFKDRYKRTPNPSEWRPFTIAFAKSQAGGKRPWVWIGDVPGLNQMDNAFFVDGRAANLPGGAVRVEASGAVAGEWAGEDREIRRRGGRSSARPYRRRTRRRDPRSLGPTFWEGYRRRGHRPYRSGGATGYQAIVDGMPVFYRRALIGGGIVQDEPPRDWEPDDSSAPAPGADAADALPNGQSVDGGDEGEITRSYQAVVRWSGPHPLAHTLKRQDGGIYIVEKKQRPIYIGEALSFSRRWLVRLEVLRQLEMDVTGYSVRLGQIVSANVPLSGQTGSRLREAVEHTLIRGLARQGIKTRNILSTQPFLVGTISLKHTGTPPSYVLSAPTPQPNQTYEAMP